jgi:tellurite resistance protein TerC
MGASIGTPLLWIGFTALILVMLALDLGVFNRKAHTVRPREALLWTLVWVGLALAFNVFIWVRAGAGPGMEFLTGYLIEKALSVDNIFVFLIIFSYFSVPAQYQHRVLFWGVFGAIVLRAIFIALGAALLHQFHWIIFVFGGFLIFTGFRILVQKHEDVHPERNPLLVLFRRFVPMTRDYHGAKFFVMEAGKRLATPLLMVLVAVEATDVVFAVDSIPAIFAVTDDPFIVYTSNIFAILGLRGLYFLLGDIMDRFTYLKFGLGSVLIFVGGKMVISDWYKVPVGVSLAVVAGLLLASIAVSLLHRPTEPPLPTHEHGGDPEAPPFPRDEGVSMKV